MCIYIYMYRCKRYSIYIYSRCRRGWNVHERVGGGVERESCGEMSMYVRESALYT